MIWGPTEHIPIPILIPLRPRGIRHCIQAMSISPLASEIAELAELTNIDSGYPRNSEAVPVSLHRPPPTVSGRCSELSSISERSQNLTSSPTVPLFHIAAKRKGSIETLYLPPALLSLWCFSPINKRRFPIRRTGTSRQGG